MSAGAGSNLASNVKYKPRKALEIGAETSRVAVSSNAEAALSTTPAVINFKHTAQGFCIGQFFRNSYKYLFYRCVNVCR